jgi:acetyltransferase-like isoleucine patch superfamily enzyme
MRTCGNDAEFNFPIYAHGLNYVSAGDHFKVGSRFRIEVYDRYLEDSFCPQIIIGNNVNINFDCHIACINKIVIGNNVLIASKVLITDHFHGALDHNALLLPPISRRLVSKGGIMIGNNVWIGEGAVIMPNVSIGDNTIVGANSVVTKSTPNHSVVAGNPARVIKMLDSGNNVK